MSEISSLRAALHWRMLSVFLALLVLTTWLFRQAGEISTTEHYTYLHALRQAQQADTELNGAILASYAGLLQNYDPVRRHLVELADTEARLDDFPSALPEDMREHLQQAVEGLIALRKEKAIQVDRFQRGNSVLRNSESYFPRAADDLLLGKQAKENAAFSHFVRHLLTFMRGASLDDAAHLQGELRSLRDLSYPAAGFAALLAHAEVIIARRPEVNGLVEAILATPTAAQLDQIGQIYAAGHEAAQQRAAIYRGLLYVVSLLLAGNILLAMIRIERDRRDLAERYAAQQRAERQLRLYATVFTNATEGMTITDADSRVLAVNPAFVAITGYNEAEIIGKTPAMLNSGRQDAAFYRKMWGELTSRGQWQGEIWNRRKDGGIYPQWLSVAAIRDESGVTTHYIGVFTDISERKQNEARIHHLAHHDALTGLPNRLLLEDRMQQGIHLARRTHRPIAVVFIDLDRFKNINDTLGHEIGDNLLIQAAHRGMRVLRETDTLSRQGGDEFVAILSNIDSRQDAALVVRKLLAALCQPYLLAGHELTISGSAGIALYPDDGQTISELLRKADAAMYRAKEEGRNTFRFFGADINTASLGELLLENDLYGALERNELEMYYQPKVDARSGELLGAEALMRWRHPVHGMISPARFIPLAEENGLIGSFGAWAIDSVCAQQRAWLDAGLLAVPVAVNISAQQFGQQDLPELVAHALAENGLPPQLLDLELTESLLMRNADLATGVLQRLRKMHVNVAIDDFGTGYSSLSYLKQFPVQSLKIDRSFVCEITDDGEPANLASAIIAMAHELGLTVVAEGVETDAQARYLAKRGCDHFQGYLFGRPQPVGDFGKLLCGRQLAGLD